MTQLTSIMNFIFLKTKQLNKINYDSKFDLLILWTEKNLISYKIKIGPADNF